MKLRQIQIDHGRTSLVVRSHIISEEFALYAEQQVIVDTALGDIFWYVINYSSTFMKTCLKFELREEIASNSESNYYVDVIFDGDEGIVFDVQLISRLNK